MSRAHEVTWWGGFDPYTFGVWCNQDKIFDLADSHNANFLFLRTLVEPPDGDHVSYIKKLKSDQERVLAYTAFTMYVHEWRHWYDMTSTPFGLARTGQLGAFFATIASAYDELGNYAQLYTPLIHWAKMPRLVKAAYPNIGELSPFVCELLQHALVILKKADTSLRATASVAGTNINTTQILESLAMLRQEQALEDAFGANAARLVRQSIKTLPGGEKYYVAIEFLEAKGVRERDFIIQILETTLFANYGVFGSQSPITPPIIFEELLSKCSFDGSRDLEDELDRALKEIQGFDRQQAFQMSYNTMARTMEQIGSGGAAESDQGSHVARMLTTMSVALRSAFLMGGAARFGVKQEARIPGISKLNKPEPYVFYAPLMVEGNPGQLAPDALKLPIITLAGVTFESGMIAARATEEMQWRSSNSLSNVKPGDGPYTMSVVWTPRMEDPENAPPYFAILNLFSDLMYWQGVLFGKDSMAPATYFFTAETTAEERGQKLVS